MRAVIGIVLGVLGALAGLTASAYGFVIYLVNGTNGVGNPYAARVGFDIAAFVLALVVGAGAVMLRARPQLGGVLMIGGSALGLAAMLLFNVNTWYALAVPLSLAGTLLGLAAAPGASSAVALRWLVVMLLAVCAVLGYFFAGFFAAAVLALLFVLAGAMQLAWAR